MATVPFETEAAHVIEENATFSKAKRTDLLIIPAMTGEWNAGIGGKVERIGDILNE